MQIPGATPRNLFWSLWDCSGNLQAPQEDLASEQHPHGVRWACRGSPSGRTGLPSHLEVIFPLPADLAPLPILRHPLHWGFLQLAFPSPTFKTPPQKGNSLDYTEIIASSPVSLRLVHPQPSRWELSLSCLLLGEIYPKQIKSIWNGILVSHTGPLWLTLVCEHLCHNVSDIWCLQNPYS